MVGGGWGFVGARRRPARCREASEKPAPAVYRVLFSDGTGPRTVQGLYSLPGVAGVQDAGMVKKR